MSVALALLTLMAAQTQSPSVDAADVARYAIIVGYNGGGDDGRAPLAYADDDAARFFLQQMEDVDRAWLLTTFDVDSARVYPDLAAVARPPTGAELARTLGEANWIMRTRKEAGLATELVLYFAGHGDVSPAGEGFLVLADGPLTRSALSTHVVRASVAEVNHIILDACASYFMVYDRGGEAEATSSRIPLSPALLDLVRAPVDDVAVLARTGTFLSTSDSAAVHESGEIGGGLFSYLLRSALSGAGDTNQDGRVEYSEAAAFVASASASLADPRARLNIHVAPPLQRPNAALRKLGRDNASRYLSVDTPGPSHVRLLDEQGMPYVEFHRDGGPATLVSLVGNKLYVVQVGDREAVLVPRRAGAYALSSLRFEKAAAGRGGEAPFRGLFEQPFGGAFLAGYLAESSLVPPRRERPVAVAFAAGAEPPSRLPLREMAVGAFATAGALVLAAGACAVGNLGAFAAAEREFRQSAAVDGARAAEVEGWRTAATVLGVAAAGATLSATGLWWAADVEEASRP